MNNWMLNLLKTEAGRRLQLQLLMNLVTGVTGQKRQMLLGMPAEKALACFAHYTATQLPQDAARQERLYEASYRLGNRLRKVLRIRTDGELTRTVILLYRNIGIDMQGMLPGEVCVKRCFFSSHYTPQLCHIASRMDAGVICGLAQNGHLHFSQRITEGCKTCKAKLII